jgi:dipeptidyl-peptidase-4
MKLLFAGFFFLVVFQTDAQQIKWDKDGSTYYIVEAGEIIEYSLPSGKKSILVSREKLVPGGKTGSLDIESYDFSPDNNKVLIFTNTKKVWRYNTKGDYWLYNILSGSLKKLGRTRPAFSLMFAKLSPDGKKVAYLSNYNLYVEDLATGSIKALTVGGHRKLINGTFDWAYEEEFFAKDGFRWSPDSKNIAYWQIDARNVKDYLMINNTDSIYPKTIPVEYPVVGELPSPFKIGVVNIATTKTKWMNIPYEAKLGSYAPRMDWVPNSKQVLVQHLNRKQNESRMIVCDITTGAVKTISTDTDSAWVDIMPIWDDDYVDKGFDWLENGNEFLWSSEKDGWRHLYRIDLAGKEILITQGNYDVIDVLSIDEKGGFIYFAASPENATQKYLYRTKLDGSSTAELISPSNQKGTHNYNISPTGEYAFHIFSNHYTPTTAEWISLPDHKAMFGNNAVNNAVSKAEGIKPNVEFFKITSSEGVEMDAWMSKPANFDSTKKYPVLFYVYTEPWGPLVKDQYNIAYNHLYRGNLSRDGYFYIAIDNRGTIVPKGRAWRKAIYKKIGILNISDQAMAAKEILKWKFIDTSRVAVWGWSGGGSATLSLMFQFPEIYKTGISVAAVTDQLTYDNIYQERYMGLPEENKEEYLEGSPVTQAKNLKGHLLYIHGTGDDNVHYNNAEMLLNELIRSNKQFRFMSYPNRTHNINEGEGTSLHLSTMYTNFLREFCPGGGR